MKKKYSTYSTFNKKITKFRIIKWRKKTKPLCFWWNIKYYDITDYINVTIYAIKDINNL